MAINTFKLIMQHAVRLNALKVRLQAGAPPLVFTAQGATPLEGSEGMTPDMVVELQQFFMPDHMHDLGQGFPARGSLVVKGIGEFHLMAIMKPNPCLDVYTPAGHAMFEHAWAQIDPNMNRTSPSPQAIPPAPTAVARGKLPLSSPPPDEVVYQHGEHGGAVNVNPPMVRETDDLDSVAAQNSEAAMSTREPDAPEAMDDEPGPIGNLFAPPPPVGPKSHKASAPPVAAISETTEEEWSASADYDAWEEGTEAGEPTAPPTNLFAPPPVSVKPKPDPNAAKKSDMRAAPLPPPPPPTSATANTTGFVPQVPRDESATPANAPVSRSPIALSDVSPDFSSLPASDEIQAFDGSSMPESTSVFKLANLEGEVTNMQAMTPTPASFSMGFEPIDTPPPPVPHEIATSTPVLPPQPIKVPSLTTPLDKAEEASSTPAKPELRIEFGGDQQRESVGGHHAIDDLLRAMLNKGASDLHLTAGEPAYMRVDGEMAKLTDKPIPPEQMAAYLLPIMPTTNRNEFAAHNDTDFAYEIRGTARFRVNIFRDRRGVGSVMRQIPAKVLTADQLGLPPVIRKFTQLSKGLVLVTGPTGSGKSTTLAAMIDLINRTYARHIITIEDPIEFVYEPIRSLINQREVGRHTGSFSRALRAALREDPDIVLVGEMRDLETVKIAIETAETGHLVFGTLHTTTAISTVDRIIDQFSADQQEQIRMMLANSLKGVVAQTLLRKRTGGRVAAHEILVVSKGVSALIRDGKNHMIANQMQTQKQDGNVLLNESLIKLVEDKVVNTEEAYIKAVDKDDLLKMFAERGIRFRAADGSAA